MTDNSTNQSIKKCNSTSQSQDGTDCYCTSHETGLTCNIDLSTPSDQTPNSNHQVENVGSSLGDIIHDGKETDNPKVCHVIPVQTQGVKNGIHKSFHDDYPCTRLQSQVEISEDKTANSNKNGNKTGESYNCKSLQTGGPINGHALPCIYKPELIQPPQKLNEGEDDTKKTWTDEEKMNLAKTCAMKVLYMGESGAGKTSLVGTIMTQKRYRTSEDDRTVIADFRNWTISSKRKTFTFVDVGGHPSYQASSHFFHCNSPNNVAAVCQDISSGQKGYQTTFNWIKSVLTRSPRCHIIPVLTKVDLICESEQDKCVQDFIVAIRKYLGKEIRLLKASATLARKRGSPKINDINKLVEKYTWLLENLENIVTLTSCICDLGVSQFVNKLMSLSEMDENKISIPEHYQVLYSRLGKLGVRLPKSNSQNILDQDLGKTRPYTNGYKNGSRMQYVMFNDALTVYESILEESSLPVDNLEGELKNCLNCLHAHGLLMYYDGVKQLGNIIFNDIHSFVNVLKCVFHHNSEHFLSSESEQFANLIAENFENNQKSYEDAKDLLHKQGLLSIQLLKFLLELNNCQIDPLTVMELLQQLKVGFLFKPNGMKILHSFIPFFIRGKESPKGLSKPIADIKRSDESNLAYHFFIKGSIPVTFWHCLLVQIFERLHHDSHMQGRQIWETGFWAPLGKKGLKLYLKYNDDDQIDCYIKGCIKDTAGHDLLWDYIKYIHAMMEKLINEWWPGLAASKIYECIHCSILIQTAIVQLSDVAVKPCPRKFKEICLDKFLMDVTAQKEVTESYSCEEEPGAEFPAGLLGPLPNDEHQKSVMLKQVQKYLCDAFQRNDGKPERDDRDKHAEPSIITESQANEKPEQLKEVTEEDLSDEFKKMKQKMKGLKIPGYIYKYRKGRNVRKIFFDCAKNSQSKAEEFIYKHFEQLKGKNMLHFTVQETPPTCSMESDEKKNRFQSKVVFKRNEIDNSNQTVCPLSKIETSARIMHIRHDQINQVKVDQDIHNLNNIFSCCRYSAGSYGSIGGFMYQVGARENIYMITASHILMTEKEKDVKNYETGHLRVFEDHIPRSGMFQEDNFPVIGELGSPYCKIEEIGKVFRGGLYYKVGDDGEFKAVDIGAIKVTQESLSHCTLQYIDQYRNMANLRTFKGNDSDLFLLRVQKYGYQSSTTYGKVIGVDEQVTISNNSFGGAFVVESDNERQMSDDFCIKGDSGSLVVSELNGGQAWVYGSCFSTWKNYKDEDQPAGYDPRIIPQVTICVRMDHGIDFLDDMFNLKLEWCTGPISFDNEDDEGISIN